VNGVKVAGPLANPAVGTLSAAPASANETSNRLIRGLGFRSTPLEVPDPGLIAIMTGAPI
jgi:hypothetical protein